MRSIKVERPDFDSAELSWPWANCGGRTMRPPVWRQVRARELGHAVSDVEQHHQTDDRDSFDLGQHA